MSTRQPWMFISNQSYLPTFPGGWRMNTKPIYDPLIVFLIPVELGIQYWDLGTPQRGPFPIWEGDMHYSSQRAYSVGQNPSEVVSS